MHNLHRKIQTLHLPQLKKKESIVYLCSSIHRSKLNIDFHELDEYSKFLNNKMAMEIKNEVDAAVETIENKINLDHFKQLNTERIVLKQKRKRLFPSKTRRPNIMT